MSWLGVNLNQSLSSITGQISSFTRDVLAEEDEIKEDELEILIPKKRIKEFEKSIVLHQQEIQELKINRLDLENRLRSEDYTSSQKATALQQQLVETQDELRRLNEKSSEWGWEIGLKDDAKGPSPHGSQKHPESFYVERVSALEAQLAAERRKHEDEVLALQEAHAHEARKNSNNNNDKGTASATTQNVHVSASAAEEDEKAAVAAAEEDEKAAAAVVAKDQEIAHLQQRLTVLEESDTSLLRNRDELAKSLEELDAEHQIIIDDLLKSKKYLSEDLEDSRAEMARLVEGRKPEVDELEALRRRNAKLEKQEKEEKKKRDEGKAGVTKRLEKEVEDWKAKERKARKEGEVLRGSAPPLERERKDLKDKVMSLEEEVLKLEAVLEEKSSEHEGTCRRLRQHEAVAKETIQEWRAKEKGMEEECQGLRERLSHLSAAASPEGNPGRAHEDLLKEIANKVNVQSMSELPCALDELMSEIASLRCERDRLEEASFARSQERTEACELAKTLEEEKADMERENEDLRDQLEELGCGERGVPEGALTPRSLPTIEEEEVDPSSSSSSSSGLVKGGNTVERATPSSSSSWKDGGSEGGGGSSEEEVGEKMAALRSEVGALSEARQNLEMELSGVKREKKEAEVRVAELSLRLGNLSNLEVEALSLRAENQRLKESLDTHSEDDSTKAKLEKQIQQMTHAMDKMNFDSAHLLSKEEAYAREMEQTKERISSQNKTIHEYFHEMARLKALLGESASAAAQRDADAADMQASLDKTKGLVIYKDDQIDQLKQGVHQIGALFGLGDGDLRDTYVRVKQEHFALVTKLKDTEEKVEELWETVEELKEEEEGEEREEAGETKEGGGEAWQKMKEELEVANTQLRESQMELEKLKETKENEDAALRERQLQCQTLLAEKADLVTRLSTLESEAEGSVEEATVVQGLKQDLLDKAAAFEAGLASLQEEITAKAALIEAAKQAESEARTAVEAGQAALGDLKEKERKWNEESAELRQEKEAICSQVASMQTERGQLIAMSTQKHQESVSYYAELQRLTEVIIKEKEASSAEIGSLNQKLKEASEQVSSLQHRLSLSQEESVSKEEASNLKGELTTKSEELRSAKNELAKVSEEWQKEQEMHKSATKERDHLRVANSSFNSQYEDKSKEVSALQEKERHLTQEATRLKQHLIEVEETYTHEAVQSEQREAALRQSLAKAHEKLSSHSALYSNNNQKAAAQLDSIQEQLDEARHERDEARLQLGAAEEASMQHQEALARLQQVLHDFQKNQTRDVVMATEREKRRGDEERAKNAQLQAQLDAIMVKCEDLESRLGSTKSLRGELQAKEDKVVALKSQVQAVQMAAKQHQDKVALLQSSSDAKVDKHLMRNLLVGYFATPGDKQREVLRVVAHVLDFSPEERARTGLDLQPGSWLSSIANFLAPPPSNVRVASKVDLLDHSSLSQAFIRFLEDESLPKPQPRLPAVKMAEEAHQKAQKKAQSKANAFQIPPGLATANSTSIGATASPVIAVTTSVSSVSPLVPRTSDCVTEPSSSPPPHSFLFTAPPPALPGAFSLISTPALSSTTPISNPHEVSANKFLNTVLNSKEEAHDETSS